MVSITASSADANLLYDKGQNEQHAQNDQYFTKALELYEFANHIMLSQAPSNTSFAEKLGLPHLYQKDELCGIPIQFDICLNKWEKALPYSLRLDVPQINLEEILQRQRVMIHLR